MEKYKINDLVKISSKYGSDFDNKTGCIINTGYSSRFNENCYLVKFENNKESLFYEYELENTR